MEKMTLVFTFIKDSDTDSVSVTVTEITNPAENVTVVDTVDPDGYRTRITFETFEV